MEESVKKKRRSKIQRSLSNIDKIIQQTYMQKKLLNVLQSSNGNTLCFNNLQKRSEQKLQEAAKQVAESVQEKVPGILRDRVVVTMDDYAKYASAQGGKEACNFELPIILKGLHEIYPFPDMKDQTPLNVRSLYEFLHFLSLGQHAPELDEGAMTVLREAYMELMDEVNSVPIEIVTQLADVINNPQPRQESVNNVDQTKLQLLPDFTDLGFNLFQMPPDMLLQFKDIKSAPSLNRQQQKDNPEISDQKSPEG
uniref:Uncharacterized protein n=1 Tax=Nyssomyia neivai TaxID=330878 RepID=A0A1L8D8Z0_9DIPT